MGQTLISDGPVDQASEYPPNLIPSGWSRWVSFCLRDQNLDQVIEGEISKKGKEVTSKMKKETKGNK